MSLSSSSLMNDTFTDSELNDNRTTNSIDHSNNQHLTENDIDTDYMKNDSTLDIQQLLLNFKENEPIFDNELLYPTPKESEIVHFKDEKLIQGTVEAIISYVTSPDVLNYQFLVDFFLTFRTYIDSLPLLELLLCRLSWCLKNSLSNDIKKAFTGRLVLVRTFVTIRHWLLNHFQDDFINNQLLRQLFTNTINELSKYEIYVGNDNNNLQSKIIKDLKKNYLTLCSIYWNLNLNIFDIFNNDLLNYNILPYNDLNNSRLSEIALNHLNDPSTRRSTLLYMFDNQSSLNLLNESIKQNNTNTGKTALEFFLDKNSISRHKFNHLNKSDDNSSPFLYPKASLNALEIKKSKSKSSTIDSYSIDQLYSNICNQPISGFISLDPSLSPMLIQEGFTTRGNIEIFEDSKVNNIESLTEEIKKDQPIKPSVNNNYNNNNSNKKAETKTIQKPETKTMKRTHIIKPVPVNNLESKPKKKGFFKSLFNHHDKENINISAQTNISKSTSTVKKVALTKTTDNNNEKSNIVNLATTYNIIQDLEKNIMIGDNNIDYLEDLVIRDYQIMMQMPSFKQRYSKQIKNSNRKSVLSTEIMDLNYKRESKFDPQDSPSKINKNETYYEGQLEKSINTRLNNSSNDEILNNHDDNNEKSFQTPPDTMNWSESLDNDNSNNDVFIDMGVTNEEIQDVSELDDTSCFNNNEIIRDQKIFGRKGISSLQINRNSLKQEQLLKRGKCNSDSKVLYLFNNNNHQFSQLDIEDDYSRTTANRTTNNRFSVNLIGRNSMISNKSYMTYDSDFSASSRSGFNLKNDVIDEENKLRKKTAISNLRIDNSDNNDLSNHNNINENTSHDINLDINENFTSSILTNNDLDMSNIHVLQELPFYNFMNFGDHSSTNSSGISILPSPTPSQTCYNGLSQTDINELAAIPDEKLNEDPLHYTLSKLRGEKSKPKVIIGLNDVENIESEEEIHRKHAVAIVCQSPVKENVHSNLNSALRNDKYGDDNDSDYDSNEERKLEKQVRDLYISNNNLNESSDMITPNISPYENDKIELNVISTASLCKNSIKRKNSGVVLTRVSSSKLLRDDGERSCFEMQSLLATPKALNLNLQLPNFTVSQVLIDELHIPFIFKYDSEKLAKQMTLIERDIMMEVEWKELINLKWDQPLSPYNSWLRLLLDLTDKTGLQLITLRFNLVNNWIISEILLCKNFTLRVLAITRFIQLAHKCRKIQNYGTLFQIMLALNSEVMKQLKSTWIRIDPGTILRFKELKDLTSPNNNFKNYRDELEKIVPSKGFIPFLPLELSDLTMYSEMPTIISSKVNNNGYGVGNGTGDELDSLDDFEDGPDSSYDLVNFQKFTITGETVKKTLRYIEWSRFYNFETDNEVISKCLYISSLSEEDMEVCLKEIEIV